MKKSGVNVMVDQRPKPKLGAGDVAVLFQIVHPLGASILQLRDQEAEYRKQFFESVQDGATGLIIPLQSDYLTASRQTLKESPYEVKNLFTGEKYTITSGMDPSLSVGDPEFAEN